jgi:hypothetical protein
MKNREVRKRHMSYDAYDGHMHLLFFAFFFLVACSGPQTVLNNTQKSISGAIKHAQSETDKMVQPVVDTYNNAKVRATKAKMGVEKMDEGKQQIIDSLSP